MQRTLAPYGGLIAFCVLVAGVPSARARGRAELTLEAHPSRVAVGDRITVTVAVSVVAESQGGLLGGPPFRDYRAPRFGELDLLRKWSNQSQQISIVNGRARMQNTVTYYYVLVAKKAGTVHITPAQVRFHGQVSRSQGAVIQVDAGPATPPPVAPGQQPSLQGNEEVFVQVVPDKTTAWVSQQVTVTWYVYFRSQLQGMPAVRLPPKADDFLSEDLPFAKQQATRTLIGGVTYGVVPILRKAYFPQRSGKLRIGSLTVLTRVVGQGFFQVTPTTRSSSPAVITVKPLPTRGRPPGFHPGNVGRFRVRAQVKPTKLDARGAASLQVVVSGAGYLHGLKVDRITHMKGFKVRFAGQRTEVDRGSRISGRRINEYLLVPARTGTLKIPPICFPYFDPTRGAYVTNACSRPMTVTVTGHLSPSGAKDTGAGGRENELRRQIKPILQGKALHPRRPFRLYRSPLRWLLFGGPPLFLILFLAGRSLRRRLSQDTEARRRREARGRARRRLRKASALLKSGDHVAFFGEVAAVLHEQVGGRLGVRVQGLTSLDLRELLKGQGADPELVEALIETLEACDFARFAPAAADRGEMKGMLERTRSLLGRLEQSRIRAVRLEEANG